MRRVRNILLAFLAWSLLGPGSSAARKRPAPARPTGPTKVAAGPGSQVRPSVCRLNNGTLLLTFEHIFTAHRRRVYVARKRPGFGWSWARVLAVPTKGDFTHRNASIVARGGAEVLVYVQAGDIRRRRAGIRLFGSTGDTLKFGYLGRIKLGASKAAWTEPHAVPLQAGGVLLTVTRRFAGALDGCYLTRSAKGRRFAAPVRISEGERCRVVELGKRKLLLTYHLRKRRRDPMRTFYRISPDGGKSWGVATPVAKIWNTHDVHAVVRPDQTVLFLYLHDTRSGSVIQSIGLPPADRVERRLTRPGSKRDISPFGLVVDKQVQLFFARESRRMDFDVLSLRIR
ncbi:MAG: sialidase family protein [bacterium]